MTVFLGSTQLKQVLITNSHALPIISNANVARKDFTCNALARVFDSSLVCTQHNKQCESLQSCRYHSFYKVNHERLSLLHHNLSTVTVSERNTLQRSVQS